MTNKDGGDLSALVITAMRAQLPTVAANTLATLVVEVPEYAGAFSGQMGISIDKAVQMALDGLLRLAATTGPARPATESAREGAYGLGRGEARSGRTMDALLTAYRVGARVAWRELSATAVDHGVPAAAIARFAELVFAYIDGLSAESVAGHTDELATSGRVREQYRERLGQALLAGADEASLTTRAKQCDWEPPPVLAAVLVPAARVRVAVALLDLRTLVVPGPDEETTVLLVPDRVAALRLLNGRGIVVGPARPWASVAISYARTVRARTYISAEGLLDTEEHLTELVLGADEEAGADLQTRALAPLEGLRPAVKQRLAETLRSWLLHQGRRDEVAAELFIHAQTVRYRMSQLREVYGDRTDRP